MNKIYTIGLLAMFAMAMFSVSLALAEENASADSMGPNGEIDYSTGLISGDSLSNDILSTLKCGVSG